MVRRKQILITIGIFLIVSLLGFGLAQLSVPPIPNSFTVNCPTLPQPLPGQYLKSIPYVTNNITCDGIKVWSNEQSGIANGNITYSFRIRQPQGVVGFKKSFEYSVFGNPVTEIQNNMQQTALASIHIPSQPTPLATGNSPNNSPGSGGVGV